MRGYRKRNRRVSVTVEGVMALAEWSDSGDDTNLVILTDDEEEYYIDARDSTVRLFKYINSRVEASGKMYELDGQAMFAVRRIRVADDIDDSSEPGAEGGNFGSNDDGDFWSDDGIVDHYARFARGSRDYAD